MSGLVRENVVEKTSLEGNNSSSICYVPGNIFSLLPHTFQTSFLETMLGGLGRLSCLEVATESSPSHFADGSSAAPISPGEFSASGLWKAPLDLSLIHI